MLPDVLERDFWNIHVLQGATASLRGRDVGKKLPLIIPSSMRAATVFLGLTFHFEDNPHPHSGNIQPIYNITCHFTVFPVFALQSCASGRILPFDQPDVIHLCLSCFFPPFPIIKQTKKENLEPFRNGIILLHIGLSSLNSLMDPLWKLLLSTLANFY